MNDNFDLHIKKNSVGILYRTNQTDLKIQLKDNKSNQLNIIVENMGRLNFGDDLLDTKVAFVYINNYYLVKKNSQRLKIKGIISNVTLDGKILTGWSSYLTSNWLPNFQTNVSILSRFLDSSSSLLSQTKYKYKNDGQNM